jgi:membrane protein DedA with SNARE-associated domain
MNAKRIGRFSVVVFLILLATFSWFFARSNSALITVDMLAGAVTDVSLWLVVYVTFALGALVAGSLALYTIGRLGTAALRQRSSLRKLEAELSSLRGQGSAAVEAPPAE